MRIKSPFRDYYDSQEQYDPDKSTVYIRKTGDQIPTDLIVQPYRSDRYWFGVIGFAGTHYPFVRIVEGNVYCYDVDVLFENYQFDLSQKQGIQRHFDRFKVDTYYKLFEKYGPIFSIYYFPYYGESSSVILSNDRLINYEFNKIVYPHIAWNNLRNYVMNMANPMKPIPEMDDVTKAELHGFNKYSFRKDKSNR